MSPSPSTETSPRDPSAASVLLDGGSGPHEGNIMVGSPGRPVCDDDWLLVNSDVVCKQLGYIGALAMTKESRFGQVADNFAMDQVL